MAVLSFQCPQCGKLHQRVNAQLAGRKVRCKCGFVFRLGPKLPLPDDPKTRRATDDKHSPN